MQIRDIYVLLTKQQQEIEYGKTEQQGFTKNRNNHYVAKVYPEKQVCSEIDSHFFLPDT